MQVDGKKPKFPLPRGYFGDVELTKEQEQYYREFCENQVQRGLLEEQVHVQNHRRVDSTKWKPVRSHHNFQLYRRRDGGLHTNDGKPSMLGVGRVEGSIEDVIYGAYDQTDEELRMTAELVDVDFGDGIVLRNIEQGTGADPYRYLGIKWILTPFPMPALMPDRDWVLLESMGITKDKTGRRYGYHTLFTIELPQCPVFPEVIRGTMWYTFIYRDAGRGMIDVHSQGFFDCLGDLIDPLTVVGSSQMFNGVFRYMKSSEAKKLTILALENLEKNIASGQVATVNHNGKIPPGSSCLICTKNRSSNPLSSRRMRVCGVCDAVVCRNCRVKKNILVGRQRVRTRVSVCHKCIASTKAMTVQPSSEKYVISRELQVGDRSDRAASVFDTLGSARRFNLASMQGTSPSTSEIDEANASDCSAASASGYSEELSRRSVPEGGLVLHAESFVESRSALTSARFSSKSPVPGAADGADAEQQELLMKMLELQESARRAHELTQASEAVMIEANVAVPPSPVTSVVEVAKGEQEQPPTLD